MKKIIKIKTELLKQFIKEEYLKVKENNLKVKENILKDKENKLKTLPLHKNEDDEIITSSGKVTGGWFSGINSAAKFIHTVAENNNLTGTLHKVGGCQFMYTYRGRRVNIKHFENGISSLENY